MAEEDFIPLNYNDWKYCITVKCGIPLTKKFIEQRLAAFNDINSEYRIRFTELYGEPYTEQVVSWFRLAEDEFKNR